MKDVKRHYSPEREKKIKRMEKMKKGLAIVIGISMVATFALSFA